MALTSSCFRYLLMSIATAAMVPRPAVGQSTTVGLVPAKLSSCPAADSAAGTRLGKIKGDFVGGYAEGPGISLLNPNFDLMKQSRDGIRFLTLELFLRGQPPFPAPSLQLLVGYGVTAVPSGAEDGITFVLPDGDIVDVDSLRVGTTERNGETFAALFVPLPYNAIRRLVVARDIVMVVGADSTPLRNAFPKAMRGLFVGAKCGWKYKWQPAPA